MKILAVDDDPFILELLTMMAKRAGFGDVSTALSGEIAVEILNNSEAAFDCLVLDISMPGMDGIELCGVVRGMPRYGKTPIIMLTAMAEKDYVDRAFRAGATDYANKPFDIVELHARLRMAEELVNARNEVATLSMKIDGLVPDEPQARTLALTDEVRIKGVKDLIGYTALGNYLMQLSRAGIAGSQVVAIKIDQVEAIHARASADEFVYMLTEAADAISEALSASGYMMGYAGNGTFVVVSDKASLDTSPELEAEIQNLLDERSTEYDNGEPLDIEVSIGNPIRPNTSKTQRIRKTFDRAIARAENRVLKKMNDSRSPGIRLIGR